MKVEEYQQLNLNSSLIIKARYNKELGELEVTFKQGDTWKYYDVSQLEINKMLLASSAGSYFLLNIKNKKRGIKI